MFPPCHNCNCRSQKDANTIEILEEEIDIVRNTVVECHHKVTKLQRAEELNERAEIFDQTVGGQLQPSSTLPRGPPLNGAIPDWIAPSTSGRTDFSTENESQEGDVGDEAPKSIGDRQLVQVKRGNQLPYAEAHDVGSENTSALLLQMIPYESTAVTHISGSADRLLSAGPHHTTATTLVTNSAVTSVKPLLDRWIKAGSAPLADVLASNVSKNYERGR